MQCLLALGQQSQTYSDCQQKTVAKKSIKVGRSSLTQIFPLRSLKTNPDAAAHRLLSLKHGKWNMSDSLEFWTMSEETDCEEKISTQPFCSRNDGLKGEPATNTPQSPLAHLPQPKILTAEQIASQIRAKLPLFFKTPPVEPSTTAKSPEPRLYPKFIMTSPKSSGHFRAPLNSTPDSHAP